MVVGLDWFKHKSGISKSWCG